MSIPVAKQYILDFENLGFGMFVHWGLYSSISKGEYTYYKHGWDKAEYEKLMESFTAEDFNAEELVLMAKNAGCRYAAFTTRHHDGFSLFDTCGLNEYDSVHSAAKRDLVKEFVDACNKHGILPVLYHTTLDWHNEIYKRNFKEYLEYHRKSVELLCKNYGKIGGFWFDGNWAKPKADWEEDALYAMIRKYQPEAILINNTSTGARGATGNCELDAVTFEQGRPTPMNRNGMEKYLAAEMCQTLNQHWGIAENDLDYISPKTIIEMLCDCRKVGANFLLNVGPEAQGKINPLQRELFSVAGKWMSVFGEAIYEGRPHDSYTNGKSFILKSLDSSSLYIFAFDLGSDDTKYNPATNKYCGGVCFNGVGEKIRSIRWMDSGEELDFMQGKNMLTVKFTGYPYGTNFCVRVAKAEIEK